MKKIGIMGGTFNPIHMGHLILAQWAMDAEGLDEVWFIPTGYSYMKASQNMVSAAERFYMTNLAICGNDRMKCLDVEINRSGCSYTCETLAELHREYPEHSFYFIFGADCLFSIEQWKNPQIIFDNCSIIAAVRGDATMEDMERKKTELQSRYHADIHLMPFLQIAISSTLIRDRIRNKQSVRFLVPDSVISYIEERGFYRNENK